MAGAARSPSFSVPVTVSNTPPARSVLLLLLPPKKLKAISELLIKRSKMHESVVHVGVKKRAERQNIVRCEVLKDRSTSRCRQIE